MAAGDLDVKVRFRSWVPGAGFTSSGTSKQGKSLVVGDVDFTYATGGILLLAPALGLSTLDHVSFNVHSANNDVAGTAAAPHIPVWIESTGKLIITDDAGTEATDNQTGFLTFMAFGDSARDIELN